MMAAADGAEEPWMVKHRPRSVSEMSGASRHSVLRALFNDPCPTWGVAGGSSRVDIGALGRLAEDEMVERGGQRYPARRAAVSCLERKLLLLTGPPGVGKTTSAIAVMRDMGVRWIEVNCSMTRGMAAAEYIASVMARQQGASLLLEEIDNMDVPAQRLLADLLSKYEHSSSSIVIATCNVAESVEESLSSLLFGVSFNKMDDSDIACVLRRICAAESVSVSDAVIVRLSEDCGSDARQAVNMLQQFCEIRAHSGREDDFVYERLRFMCGNFKREADELLRDWEDASACMSYLMDAVDRRGIHPSELFESIAHSVSRRSPGASLPSAARMKMQLDLASAFKKFERRVAAKDSVLQIYAFLSTVGSILSRAHK
jgi:DNA polymerase III delta prime subunit